MIEIDSLHIGYHKITVAGPISEKIRKGELVCLLGPNGTGKSTLLKTIMGLIEPLNGNIFFQKKSLAQYSPRHKAQILSIVLTEPIVVGNFSALEIVELGRYPYKGWWGKSDKTDLKIAHEALQQTGGIHLANKKFTELSDGEKQKIMIARALAQDTDYILLDEPTSHLDLPSKIEIMTLLKNLAHQWNKSILVSTHDINLAIQAADKFWLIDSSGKFDSGVNEDLILTGQLNKCFLLDERTYNFSTNKISIPHKQVEKINLSGTGSKYTWTRHALERSGFQFSKNAEIKIDTSTEDIWKLLFQKEQYQFRSISGLLEKLRALINQPLG